MIRSTLITATLALSIAAPALASAPPPSDPRTVKQLAELCPEGAPINSACGRYILRIAHESGLCFDNEHERNIVDQGIGIAHGRVTDTPNDPAEATLAGWFVLLKMITGDKTCQSG